MRTLFTDYPTKQSLTSSGAARSGGTCTFSDTGVEIDEGRKVVYRYKKIGDEPALMSSNG